MTAPLKQHLIDPEICIRCHTCEMTCPIGAIEHDDNNVVVDPEKCNHCMDCIPVCPTGSIDEWRVVESPYALDEQYSWMELPEQADISLNGPVDTSLVDSTEQDPVAKLLEEAHRGAGGKATAPASAAAPTINLYNMSAPIEARVQGNYRITSSESDADVRHIVLDLQGKPFPVLEGQSVGVIAPGNDNNGKAHLPRLYSISSPRDGERQGYHNLSLTVKREAQGVCSNYLCDLSTGDTLNLIGPFGATFLLPSDPAARLLMICTGTGAAPMRAFTMARERSVDYKPGGMVMFFGARTPQSLPYFGPLKKIPSELLDQHLVYSRIPNEQKEYVQDRMLAKQELIAEMLEDTHTHIYLCGLKAMEEGVEQAFTEVCNSMGTRWLDLRDTLREEGRYHVETY